MASAQQKAKAMHMLGATLMLVVAWWAVWSAEAAAVECTTVTALISACSTFVSFGSPEPVPGSQCCDAVATLSTISDAVEKRKSVCRCVMDLITTYNPNGTAIATLPGFCGISLGFNINPNTDCNRIGEMGETVGLKRAYMERHPGR